LESYLVQFRELSIHLWSGPTIRINKKRDDVSNKMKVLDVAIIIGIGISKTISISNIIKITANRKNRVENGIRAVLIGSIHIQMVMFFHGLPVSAY
jgi:hypothetical protein